MTLFVKESVTFSFTQPAQNMLDKLTTETIDKVLNSDFGFIL